VLGGVEGAAGRERGGDAGQVWDVEAGAGDRIGAPAPVPAGGVRRASRA
jgi:hypothetical protein